MRFAIDAHAIGQHLTGNEVYVRSLLGALAEVDGESDFLAYVSQPGAERWIPRRVQTRKVASNAYFRLAWNLGRRINEDRPDLIHVQYTAPLFGKAPVIVTVHDVSFLDHPEYFRPLARSRLQYTVARTIGLAERVLTVSDFSRRAILRHYEIPADKVRVVLNAANPEFRVIGRERVIENVRRRLGFDAPFVLTVGDLQPRKNHIGLIAAFAKLLGAFPHLKHHLVAAGKETWFAPNVQQAALASGVAERIHFPGFVSDAELHALYNTCDCFIFPSFYEGFGLPVLEAMACGRAVACSNTSALPEVAGGAALLFDPHRIEEMTGALSLLLLNAELSGSLSRQGIRRASHFTWRKSARGTLEVYKEVVRDARGRERKNSLAVEPVSEVARAGA